MVWTLESLLSVSGAGFNIQGDGNTMISGITHDTRSLKKGDLYCCLRGEHVDGHDFAGEALRLGASTVLADRPGVTPGPVAVVANVRDVLGSVAAAFYHQPSRNMQLIGVTGTNGKTTVTYLVESIAAAAGKTSGVIGSIEARLDGEAVTSNRTTNTPEAVELQALLAAMRDRAAEVVCMEVTSEGLAKKRVDGTEFTCVAFTNLTQDHLNYHGTMENYFSAKSELFTRRFTSQTVIGLFDDYGRSLSKSVTLPVLTCGPGGDIYTSRTELSRTGTKLTIETPQGSVDVASPLVGGYNVENILIATGVAISAELPLESVAGGLSTVEVAGRLEKIDAGQPFAVIVDYAHTPGALKSVLQAARKLSDGRLIVMFGCGGDRDAEKRPIMGSVATKFADLSIITSDNPRSEDPEAIISQIVAGSSGAVMVDSDRRSAITKAIQEASAGDIVVLAGKGHETGQTFDGYTIDFDDRIVAREVLQEL